MILYYRKTFKEFDKINYDSMHSKVFLVITFSYKTMKDEEKAKEFSELFFKNCVLIEIQTFFGKMKTLSGIFYRFLNKDNRFEIE